MDMILVGVYRTFIMACQLHYKKIGKYTKGGEAYAIILYTSQKCLGIAITTYFSPTMYPVPDMVS
jgi:hypothetical protein